MFISKVFTAIPKNNVRNIGLRAFSTSENVVSCAEFGIYGGVKIPYSDDLNLRKPDEIEVRSAFRILNDDGKVRENAVEPKIEKEEALKLMENMIRLEVMDGILYDAQRQGRISFYMTSAGEEGLTIGSASGLKPQDMIFAQYREAGVLMYRGFTLQNFADQCFSNIGDPCKGRQMPVHYGSKVLNYQTISSPLGTQIPQAVGAAYQYKLNQEDRIAVCYFGDGAASEGDFHPALNFAATLECPVVFVCRNNGYAISTPTVEQYRGDGIIGRADGYGVASVRVDGNDVLAVKEATEFARDYAQKNSKPVLLEAMSYRQGHHSTSDDSTRYREVDEIQNWKETSHPISRFQQYIVSKGWWDEEKEASMRDHERSMVLQAMVEAENKGKPDPFEDLFNDVYQEIPENLVEQREVLKEQMRKYPDHYTFGDH